MPEIRVGQIRFRVRYFICLRCSLNYQQRSFTRSKLYVFDPANFAITVEDLLDRRTRVGLVPDWRAAALEAAERVVPDLIESLA